MRRIAESPDEQARNQGLVLKRLLRRLKPYWLPVSGAFVMVVISAGMMALGPILIGRATDQFITAGNRSGLGRTSLLLIGVYLLGMLANRFQIYWMSWAGQNLLADLRKEIISKIESLSLQYLEGEESGDLMSRLVNDIDAINTIIGQGLIQAVGGIFSLIGVVVAMFTLNASLALAALSVVPLMILATGKFSDWSRSAFRRTRETIGDVSADLQEELSGVKVAQAFNRGQENISSFAERNAANRDANISANAVTSAFSPVMDLMSTLDIAFVAGLGGVLAIRGVVTIGVVVAFLQYVSSFARPIQMITQIWTLAQSSLAAAERIFELIDLEPDIQDPPGARRVADAAGEIVFTPEQDGKGVTFGYDVENPVLCDVRLVIKPGQTVALVGPTGAGKSTLVSLIPRFYEVTRGKILLDGIDIREITQRSLRSQLSMVLQEPFLFSGSIMENIRYGKTGAADSEVVDAAKAAKAHPFITRLPEGYQTEVGERGNLLSQGQRQLVSIARAILADPQILILDEATSSVDTRTELLIQEALECLLAGRTSIIIAHRLSTVRNADMIYTMQQGRIVEQGTHAQLLKENGLYAELYQRQFFVPPEIRSAEEAAE